MIYTSSFDISINYPVPSETIITWDASFTSGIVPSTTETGTTLATLSSDTGDEISFNLVSQTQTSPAILEIDDSSLNLISNSFSSVGTYDFSIKAINDTGTQVTATDLNMTIGGDLNTATVSLSLSNTYSVTGTYSENEYTDGNGDTYIAVKFTGGSGTITFDQSTEVDYLIVAGGGGGGHIGNNAGLGGGGGAGGMLTITNQTFVSSTSYTAVVGSYGSGSSTDWTNGQNGGDSTFNGTVSYYIITCSNLRLDNRCTIL